MPEILWGAAIVTLFVCGYASAREPMRYADPLVCAAMQVIVMGVVSLAGAIWAPPACWRLNPVVDLGCLAAVCALWYTHPARWKGILAGLFLLQLCLHFALWLSDKSPSVLYNYAVALNLSFMAQLAVVSWPAGGRLVADMFGPVPNLRRADRPVFPRAR